MFRCAAAMLLTALVAGNGSGVPGVAPVAATSDLPIRAARLPGSGAPTPGRATPYRAPIAGPVVVLRTFDPPATRYGAGHLGVDLAMPQGAAVLAAGAGVVRFAGQVAGRGVLVLEHPDGISTEYEPVRPAVGRAAVVRAGQRIGVLSGAHPGCARSCLHWGARRGGTYLDPLSLLAALGVLRLEPW